ncbi:beta-N-acetylhexosaminidase (plasmid) [Deinococcus sp. KNUC1210]|uniref:beta-N-acetylhexosaminidase n=1 Tax=Deinococcus sp. KNUC1210 TaxID=2917691 RepID=UPI001EF0DA71|nr:beta-N-acetylhexosaminidase [Deinococcus sp. KNUC1210]ULH14269.1 beta-N-acetylhexosaminidase [Deinococcus sp. KNUC1210]
MPIHAGQLLMVDLPSPVLDADSAQYLKEHQIGAVCLFGKNVQDEQQLRTLCRDLRAVLGEHALIAIDHEGGAIVRMNFWPVPPSAMSLGAAADVQLTRSVHAANARQLRSVGINWNFAPDMDVNVESANPVIGVRAFGEGVELVTRQALAASEGLESGSVAACVKHFPGHGDTHLDSHLALPRVDKSLSELEATEFAPFRAAAAAQVAAFMTAHIIYPALDPQHPATLSRAVLTGLLREDWQYEGVIITDSMGMRAIDDNYGRGPAAVQALAAGADMVMALGRREVQLATLESVSEALADGTLEAGQMSRSLERLHLLAQRFPAITSPDARLDTDTALYSEAWTRGLCAVRGAVPPPSGQPITVIAPREEARLNVSEAGLPARDLARRMQDHFEVELIEYDDPAHLDWPTLSADLKAAGRLSVLATTGRHRQPALRAAQPDLHLCLYNAYSVLDVDAPALVSFGAAPAALDAVMAWLRGEVQAGGTLPFTLA